MIADPAHISVTAKVSAYYRQFSDIAFAAEVATLIGADDAFAQIAREHGLEPDKLTFYAPMFEARYKSITQLVRKSGASQILELASGYSLRGLDMTQSGSLCYVETDLRPVLATKLELLENVRRLHDLAPSPLHAVKVADALDAEQIRTAAAVFDHDRPLTVLCEGLIGYLTRGETRRVAAHVRRLISEFGSAGGSFRTSPSRRRFGTCHPSGSDCGRPSRESHSVSSTLRRSMTATISNPSFTVLASTCRSEVRSMKRPRSRR